VRKPDVEIVAFLTAQYEEEARRWKTVWLFQTAGRERVDGWWDLGGTFGRAVNDIIDTTRAGRDLAAKRRILERHSSYDFPPNEDDGPGNYAWTAECEHCREPWPCPDLRDLAASYVERPGFRPEWKIDG
jgi:hypothetical protein